MDSGKSSFVLYLSSVIATLKDTQNLASATKANILSTEEFETCSRSMLNLISWFDWSFDREFSTTPPVKWLLLRFSGFWSLEVEPFLTWQGL